jgi:UDP-glucose 4-epimerase
MSQKALITGAAGFIGSHVAAQCKSLGMDVIGVDDLSGGYVENIPMGVHFIKGDITDPNFVDTLFSGTRFDYVFHLAAYAAEGLSHFIRRYNYQNNLIGSINLINNAVKNEVSCFVFTSSIAVYGRNQTPMLEGTMPRPEDPYGIAKYAIELDLAAAHELFGLNYIIFRPHNVYGERQNLADKYRNVIGIFMNQVMQGLPMTVFGDGMQTRAFSYISEVAPLISRSVYNKKAYGEVFNIGADTPYTILELAHEVAKAFGKEAKIQHLPARQEVVHAFSSHEKVKRILGGEEAVTLACGVARMALWAQGLGPQLAREFEEIEVSKNLPLSWRKR